MRKLTFEKAVLIVFILIILISTSDITISFFQRHFGIKNNPVSNEKPSGVIGFPTMLVTPDTSFKLGDYEKAADEYYKLTLNSTLSIEQKAHAYFYLGICQYKLEKYELAADSFENVVKFSPDDSLAYNNAAVSAYKANKIQKAIELQTKALSKNAAVEFYYNLARMYEDNEQYELAANNYLLVAIGEKNISKIEYIDPVRVKEKIARLMPVRQSSVSETVSSLLIALKLKDTREVFTIEENEMQVRQRDFIVKVETQKNTKNIVAEYDRKKNDPYNLISELVWTIYKDGKQLLKKTGDKLTAPAKDSGNYEISLNIKYNGVKELLSTKTVKISEYQSSVNEGSSEEVVKQPDIEEKMSYLNAAYEQLFESDFKVSSKGYTDKYNVVWGVDNGVETSLNKALSVDKISSLNINNKSKENAGLWVNLDSLLNQERLKGKSISINLFGREIGDDSGLLVSVRIKSANNMNAISEEKFDFPFQFKQKTIRVYIPEDAVGFTISLKTRAGGELNVDGFTVVD